MQVSRSLLGGHLLISSILVLIWLFYDVSTFIGELKKLKELVVDAKENNVKVVSFVVKRMLEKNMFLFGSVDMNESAALETVNQLTELQNARVQVAYKKYVRETDSYFYSRYMFVMISLVLS